MPPRVAPGSTRRSVAATELVRPATKLGRVAAPVLASRLATCVSTVRGTGTAARRPARSSCPRATSARTSASRAVTPSARRRGGTAPARVRGPVPPPGAAGRGRCGRGRCRRACSWAARSARRAGTGSPHPSTTAHRSTTVCSSRRHQGSPAAPRRPRRAVPRPRTAARRGRSRSRRRRRRRRGWRAPASRRPSAPPAVPPSPFAARSSAQAPSSGSGGDDGLVRPGAGRRRCTAPRRPAGRSCSISATSTCVTCQRWGPMSRAG